jgi:hypothetical protein
MNPSTSGIFTGMSVFFDRSDAAKFVSSGSVGPDGSTGPGVLG